MLITDARPVLLTGPSTEDPYFSRTRRSAAFIELITDGSITGLGETYAGYFIPEVVPTLIDFYRPILIGIDLEKTSVTEVVERVVRAGRFWGRVGLGRAVISGVEGALWDLRGKMLGVPVVDLLGGAAHESLPCYATGGGSAYPFEHVAAKAAFYLNLGFRAFKVGTGGMKVDGTAVISRTPEEAADLEVEKIRILRSQVGDEVDILLDGHQDNLPIAGWDVAAAATVATAVEPYRPFLFEEPMPYTSPADYAELRKRTKIPVAGGETLTGIDEWRDFAAVDAFDVAQPDAAFVGGMSEFLRIAALFGQRGKRIATHSWGAGGGLMQNLHAAFAAPNTLICEVPPAFGPLHREVVGDSFEFRDGLVMKPRAPGLGISLPDSVRERFPFVPGSGEFNSVPGKQLQDLGFPGLAG